MKSSVLANLIKQSDENKGCVEITFETTGTAKVLSDLMVLTEALAKSGKKLHSVDGQLKNGKIRTCFDFRDEAEYQRIHNFPMYTVPVTNSFVCDLDIVAFAVLDSLTLGVDVRSYFSCYIDFWGDTRLSCKDTLNYMDSTEYSEYKYYAEQVRKIYRDINSKF